MPRPVRASIDLAALRHNFGVARRHAGGARVWSVVKADAYGHGLLRAAAALAGLTDGFALLDLDEACRLRQAGLRHPILMLEGFFEPADLPHFSALALTAVLHDSEQLAMLAASRLPAPLPIYLKLNTGMNRLGFTLGEAEAVLERLRGMPQAGPITLMTHFADADAEEGIAEPLARFTGWRAGCGLPSSMANSAALLRFPEARGDWVRPGIMLYGGSPFPGLRSAAEAGLRPVMRFESRVIGVQSVPAGGRVGYGGLYRAERPARVGVVACGYADGYPRHAPTGTPILVAGRRTRTLGRVSMDMLAADLTDIPQAGVGSPVLLWGEGLPADDVAAAAATISYELFCALARRVPVDEA